MSAKPAGYVLQPRCSHILMSSVSVLAYVALTIHASAALAAVTQPAIGAGLSQGSVPAERQAQVHAPIRQGPCCGEGHCTRLVTAGPLIPTSGKQSARIPHNRPVNHTFSLVLQPAAALTAPTIPRDRWSSSMRPVYLATARLRL